MTEAEGVAAPDAAAPSWWEQFCAHLVEPDEKCECGHGKHDSHRRVWGWPTCLWCDCGHDRRREAEKETTRLPDWMHQAWHNATSWRYDDDH